ncbi:mitochondrial large ribosomal subunit, partial [Kickxella alabastrina]
MFGLISTRRFTFARLTHSTIGRAFESTVAAASEPAASTAAPQMVKYPYFVRRTRFQSLPVYSKVKNGGTRKLTMIRRIDGDIEALRTDINQMLGNISVSVKKVSQQI